MSLKINTPNRSCSVTNFPSFSHWAQAQQKEVLNINNIHFKFIIKNGILNMRVELMLLSDRKQLLSTKPLFVQKPQSTGSHTKGGGGNLSGNFPPLNAEKISDWPETGESRREEKVDVKTSL